MSYIQKIKSKIIEFNQIDQHLSLWRSQSEKIVFTNGCFDILHRGHVEYLAQAASLGTKLIIGLNADASVKRLKGNDRPINDEFSRAIVLAALGFVDGIVLFDEDTPQNLISLIIPNVLVKGGDYIATEVVGYDTVTDNGGEVIIVNFVDGFSSTSIIEKGGLS